ncbi:IclR family transcriptional regulator C-terminal domain-containing protein [Ureibacillus sp. GCM10028918]|uniref:IclR family transcriptional regulator domain-containing protein n=1 Tax=Ureibacillus sp. GCM10028918 TaxID=3273429 RepID=UPI00362119D9
MSNKNSENFKQSKDYVQSIDRMFQILNTFTPDKPSLSTSEIAQITGLSRPTVRRILLTLEYLGYVKSDHATFSLTMKIIELSSVYLTSQASVWQMTQPLMEAFTQETGESSSISILEDDKILYVARVSKKRIMSLNLEVGSTLPAVSTSMGQVLLAYLSQEELDKRLNKIKFEKFTENSIVDKEELYKVLRGIREKGWGGVDQQLEEGVRSIAVPIRKLNGEVVAAINCSVHAGRVSKQRLLEEFLPKLQELAHQVEKIVSIR